MSPALLSLVLGAMSLCAQAASMPNKVSTDCQNNGTKAVYFMTNSDGNSVIAVSVGSDGLLSQGVRLASGGKGAVGIDGSTNSSAAIDGLFSQSSVAIAQDVSELNRPPHNGNHFSMSFTDIWQSLFMVNPGSNSVTMFSIDRNDPTKLKMVGSPAQVPGDFPNTVAASNKHKVVCVGMTGANAGVSCANFDAQKGIGKMDGLRKFDLNQSNPPTGPTNTVSQVFWSTDENTLFATVKGDPAQNNIGFLSSFGVHTARTKQPRSSSRGQKQDKNRRPVARVAKKEARSSMNGTAVLFGTLPIPKTSDLFATDASFGGAILSTSKGGKGKLKSKRAVEGQKATCWVTISALTGTAFVTDVAAPRLVEMSTKDATILGEVDVASTGATGMIDLKASGKFVYTLAPGTANNSQILVIDISGGSQNANVAQMFDVSGLGGGASSQGMAIFE
ncbi:hypothetical protein PWT90_03341 [Aphanocladium album]|nr:hypothetical protein PWT90_03341 [Aphanocladium album]